MPAVDQTSANVRANRSVSFAPDVSGPPAETIRERPTIEVNRQRDSTASNLTTTSSVNPNDGTGLKFKINFQENRLRFDQTFPDKLEMRVSENEFEIVLEQIHREFIAPIDKTQKLVRKWSIIVGATAPIVVGYILSPVLARRVNRHQKALKRFWISLRAHLKTINREIYYPRGIEWRIERDVEKMIERDCYNKLYCFRIEIIFRKPVSARGPREVALTSIIDQTRRNTSLAHTSLVATISNSTRNSSRHFNDPELFALMATAPGIEEYDLIDESFDSYADNGDDVGNVDNGVGVDAGVGVDNSVSEQTSEEIESDNSFGEEDETSNENEEVSPLFVQDQHQSPDNIDSFLLKVQEPEEVTQARVQSTFEPPSPSPEASIFTAPAELDTTEPSESRMTFADLLRVSAMEADDEDEEEQEDIKGFLGSSAGLAAAMATTSLIDSPKTFEESSPSSSPPKTTSLPPVTTSTSPVLSNRASREEAFAQRQRKKFSRFPATTETQLYDIPESPKLGLDEDPAGDALNYMTGDSDDLIDDLIGVGTFSKPKDDEQFVKIAPERRHSKDFGTIPVAAYPMADAFTSLYETEEVTPLDPVNTDSESEYVEVDGETEYVRRKKWRVAPERADKLSRVQTMTETIKPSSRRSSYLPLTRITSVRKSFDFKPEK